MNPQSVPRLQNIFRAVFELPPEFDVSSVQQTTTRNWDSLAHVTLVTAIEADFGISLDVEDQLRMTSYSATATLLEEKGL